MPFHSFPRVCGDVPIIADEQWAFTQFSPRMRGCSGRRASGRRPQAVFPAYAGMFRITPGTSSGSVSFPRVCGDVPQVIRVGPGASMFSPRMRGCSGLVLVKVFFRIVFPAYAGMFLSSSSMSHALSSFPCVCGDVPGRDTCARTREAFSPRMRGCSFPHEVAHGGAKFSPRMRGCSAKGDWVGSILMVFPAYAGMFPLLVRLWL